MTSNKYMPQNPALDETKEFERLDDTDLLFSERADITQMYHAVSVI